MSESSVHETSIPGLLSIEIPVHEDSRGWFKENYQEEKLRAAGFPEFKPLQNNISYNIAVGVTRGIHAEPWEKYVSVACGRIFTAIVDLRAGDTFGRVHTCELSPATALFIPRGCANSFQTLDPGVAYTYLVNAHWSPEAQYTHVNLFDPDLAIPWPISRDQCVLSEKDLDHPHLREVVPIT